jgi:hypothetical protein
MSIFRGDVPVNETSDTPGTLSATVNNYLLTVDDAKLLKMDTTMMPLNSFTNHVVITILAKA